MKPTAAIAALALALAGCIDRVNGGPIAWHRTGRHGHYELAGQRIDCDDASIAAVAAVPEAVDDLRACKRAHVVAIVGGLLLMASAPVQIVSVSETNPSSQFVIGVFGLGLLGAIVAIVEAERTDTRLDAAVGAYDRAAGTLEPSGAP